MLFVYTESHPEHLKIWNEVQDNYLLQLLDKALNCVPGSEKKLAEMDDQEFAEWLPKQDFQQKPTKVFDVKVPVMTIKSARNYSKSEH